VTPLVRAVVGAAVVSAAWVAVDAAGPQTSSTTQAQAPTFRASTQLVEVDVRVFDAEGRFVDDLTMDDFEVFERDARQPLRGVYFVAPAPGAPERAAPLISWRGAPAALTAAPPVGAVRQTWIFAFDLNHLPPGGGFDRARTAVLSFLRDRFRDGDLGGVLAGGTMVGNRLTSVRAELEAAITSLKTNPDSRTRTIELTREFPRILDDSEALAIASGNTDALQRATVRACAEDAQLCQNADMMLREKAQRFRALMQRSSLDSLNTLTALANGLARVPGPKTVVLLSEGFVTQELESALRSTVGQTTRAGARIYAIDVRGLNRGRSADIGDRAAVEDTAGAPARFDLTLDAPNSLAVDTGGLFLQHRNNLSEALTLVERDTSQYYVLAYEPQGLTLDGSFHAIDVRVKRPGVKVRARRGYLALPSSSLLTPAPIKRRP